MTATTLENDAPSEVSTVRTSTRAGLRDSILGTRNLITVAALAVVGSLLSVPLTYIAPIVATSPRGILILCALMGLWMIPFLLPATLINKPGVFFVTGLFLGIIGTFTTSFGPMSIVGHLIGAAFVALPMVLLLYRFWTWWSYMLCAISFGGINSYAYWSTYKIEGTGPEVALSVGMGVLSCMIAVLVCLALKAALNRAGVGISK